MNERKIIKRPEPKKPPKKTPEEVQTHKMVHEALDKKDEPKVFMQPSSLFNQSVYKFVIIEDDPILNRLYKTKLELEGQQVFDTMGGHDGLELIKKINPDFVLLDINMPDMDGLEVLQELKNFEVKPKVIVLTNNEDDKVKAKALELGATDFMIKAATTPKRIFERILELAKNK